MVLLVKDPQNEPFLILYKLIELEKQLQDPTMQMLMANGLINPAALCGLDAETAKLLGIAPAPAPSKTAQVLPPLLFIFVPGPDRVNSRFFQTFGFIRFNSFYFE